MFRNRRIFGLIILVLVFLALGAYYYLEGTKTGQDEGNEQVKNQTIMVTDSLGREVAVPARVERAACLFAFTAHTAAMLGQADKIVAVPDGVKRDALLNMLYPSIGKALVPVASGYINIEELLRARPDMAFIRKETGINSAEVAKLDKFKIPYLVVDFQSIKQQQDAIEIVGKALGVENKAREYNEYYQDCINRVQKLVNTIPYNQRPQVYHAVNEATRTDTRDSLSAEWTQIAGAVNVSVDQPLRLVEGKNFASLEQILLWNPDIILANEPGVGEYIMDNPQWTALKAVQDKKVYQMPIGISRWGHPGGLETPLAILWTAKILYPQEFDQLDIRQETRSFYRQFFNYQIPDDILERVLKGESTRISKVQEAK